jgi:tRNA 2-thiouridine synthesizing protein D
MCILAPEERRPTCISPFHRLGAPPTRRAPCFAALALQADDRVTLMLFHDAVLMAVDGAGAKPVPVGPPNRYEEVAGYPGVVLWACKPCVDARGLASGSLDKRIKLGGMKEFHAAASEADTRVITF